MGLRCQHKPRHIYLPALNASFRALSRLREKYRRQGDPFGQPVEGGDRSPPLDLFFTIMAAESSWPAGSFQEWLDRRGGAR